MVSDRSVYDYSSGEYFDSTGLVVNDFLFISMNIGKYILIPKYINYPDLIGLKCLCVNTGLEDIFNGEIEYIKLTKDNSDELLSYLPTNKLSCEEYIKNAYAPVSMIFDSPKSRNNFFVKRKLML